MLSALRTRYTTWLLLIWGGLIVGWMSVARRGEAMCGFGWLRCGERGAPGSRWLEPQPLWRIALVGVAGAVVLAGLAWVEARRRKVDVTVTGRLPRVRTVAFVGVAGTFVAAHLFLFSPVWDHLLCGETVRINDTLAYPLNCDSGQFLDLAHHPGTILDSGNTRQSRPGYVFLSAAATAVIGPVASGIGLDHAYGTDDSAYVPLVLINLVIAAGTLALFAWLLLRIGVRWPIITVTAAILMLNDVTKAYFWSPHQQMFTLLVPVVTIAAGRWLRLRERTLRQVALLGLALGVSLLMYGSFIVPIGVAGLLMAYTALRRTGAPATVAALPRQQRRRVTAPALVAPGATHPTAVHPTAVHPTAVHPTAAAAGEPPAEDGGGPPAPPEPRLRRLPRLAGRLGVLGGVAAAPSLIWIAICVAVAGSYYNHETTVYHEFVWLPEQARAGAGPFAHAVSAAVAQTSQQLIEVGWLLLGVLGLLVAAAVVLGVRLVPRPGATTDPDDAASQRSTLLATAVTGAVTVVFLFGMGFWAYRITYNIVPIILIAIAWVAAKVAASSTLAKWAVHAGLGAVTAAWVVFQLVTHGPYS